MNMINKLLLLALLAVPVLANASASVHLDKAPASLEDSASLQRGAKFFIANCLACHSASYMRFNRLKDIGMSEDEIKTLLPEGLKIGATMPASMDAASAKAAFGVSAPDLSVIARSRGTDWLYTYFRSFYADGAKASGANNAVFPDVAMPNIFVGMQGEQQLKVEKQGDHEVKSLVLASPGSMTKEQFDTEMADLTNYLDFMGEPAKLVRYKIGYLVLGFLAFLFVLSYALKKEYWKDVH
ncbi:MAG: cytochrome c1 [Gallionellaceae bacterium]|nr:cytochrome c1 [Gallionellaceae bacterium]